MTKPICHKEFPKAHNILNTTYHATICTENHRLNHIRILNKSKLWNSRLGLKVQNVSLCFTKVNQNSCFTIPKTHNMFEINFFFFKKKNNISILQNFTSMS